MKSKVLVGIATHNRAAILPRAIASALDQRGCALRVSVVDDGSTDKTAELAAKFPMVEWIRWSPARGYMVARNHWMTSSTEDYFVSLDDDSWFLEGDEIAVAVEFLEANPKVAAAAFSILAPDSPNGTPRASPRRTATFIGCGHVLRLAAVRKVGVYEVTAEPYGGEERDLCLRLMDAGYEIVLLPGVHVWHDKSLVAREFPAQYRSSVCNDLAMTLRRTPALFLLPAFVVKICQHLSQAWKRGLIRSCCQGFGRFARSVPQVWRSRRPVKLATLRAFMRLARS